jgi:type II secretory pathway pseudopilin PulG
VGPGETLSLAALAVMIIAVTAILASAYRSRLAFRQREMELRLELAKVELEAARATPDTSPLEGRVRVLERIATDRARDLASQIDDLAKPDPLLN